MSRFFITALAFALIVATCLAMTSCNAIPFFCDIFGNGDGSDDVGIGLPGYIGEIVKIDLSGSIANVGAATAIGTDAKNTAIGGGGFTLLGNRNLVMTTVDGGDQLFDVTFTKIETDGATEEITGTRRAMPKNGEISIAATKGFTYAIYDNGVQIVAGILDNGADDLNPKVGVITVGGFVDGKAYDVEYTGVGKETVICDASTGLSVDRLYVIGDYTYISCYTPSYYKVEDFEAGMNGGSLTNGMINGRYVINTTTGTPVNGVYFADASFGSLTNQRQFYLINNLTGYVYYYKRERASSKL